MSNLETTEYFEDFLRYYKLAEKVQNDCNLGGSPYLGSCGDDLIENITIYDTVERRHAGFQNMLQDLWLGSSAPKYYKWEEDHQSRNRSYDNLHERFSMEEWVYLFLVHRITGSGASFEADHGYRNTILPLLVEINQKKRSRKSVIHAHLSVLGMRHFHYLVYFVFVSVISQWMK